ncbi:hypothetical protein [Deinococcus sedimenti]|uniref:DUF2190 family protein n=1 Tax=Deinococcus sedimenti TaxID=1867090 RepID=A0ABQ2S466_9DEIO|nr:hypothetical protein [Deinococcus sedimenti]GGR84459.1 hypothetical protein GCM10008960_09380 [Deinococcus sedimenti]
MPFTTTTLPRVNAPAFIAHPESIQRLEGGAVITAADFENGALAGTPVSVVGGVVKPFHLDATTSGLLGADFDAADGQRAVAVIVGGVVHVNLLPGINITSYTALKPHFVFQDDTGTWVPMPEDI